MSYGDEEVALLAAVMRHGTAALEAASRLDIDGANLAVKALYDEQGWDGVTMACTAWADTYIKYVGVPETISGIGFVDVLTGQLRVAPSPDLPVAARFVAEWLLARRDMDEPASQALLDGLDDDDVGDCVMALCFAVATALPREPARVAVVSVDDSVDDPIDWQALVDAETDGPDPTLPIPDEVIELVNREPRDDGGDR